MVTVSTVILFMTINKRDNVLSNPCLIGLNYLLWDCIVYLIKFMRFLLFEPATLFGWKVSLIRSKARLSVVL